MLAPYKPNKENAVIRFFDFLRDHAITVIITVLVMIAVIAVIIVSTDSGKKSGSSQKKQKEPVKTAKSDSKYVSTGTIRLPMNRISSLNPLTSADADTFYISQLVYSGLFKLNSDLNIRKDAVSSYKADPDSGRVQIRLKDGIRYSDGSMLTAEDVIYTVNKIKTAGKKGAYFAYVKKIKNVTGYDRDIEIVFNDKKDAALDNLIFPILNYGSFGAKATVGPAGSGKYKISYYDKNKTVIRLTPNKKYYGKKAGNQIHFRQIKNPSNTTGLITTDALTAYLSTESDARTDADDKNLKSVFIRSNEMEYLGFNFHNRLLKYKVIRQALCYAIDTGEILKENYGNEYMLCDTVYFPGFLGVKNNGDAYKYNQSKAVSLLKKCGFADRNEDGILENKKGKKLSVKLVVNKNVYRRSDAATAIKDELQDIGIHVRVKKLNEIDYRKALKNKDFDLILAGYKFDKSYNLKDLFDKGNFLNYSNSVVSSSVNRLERANSASKQKDVYVKLKKELLNDIPYYCIGYKRYTFITVKKFEMETEPTFFDIYRGIDTWKWKRTVTPDKASDTYKKGSCST